MSNESEGRRLATETRAKANLDSAPIPDVFELASAVAGADVLSVDAPEGEHGLSTVNPHTGGIVVAVATTPHPMRQRSTVAHELGHVIASDLEAEGSFTPGDRTDAEVRADAFARHLLLPLVAVKRFTGESIGEAHLSRLVQEYGVSPAIAAIQLREARLIDVDTCKAWMSVSAATLAARHGWLSQYRILAEASLRPRAPQRLMERAVTAVQAGVIDLDEAAEWYGLDAADLRDGLGIELAAERDDDLEDDYGIGKPLFGGAASS
ncbi:ImmA/IrrE family metallo-endopeptidase [Microbacterium marinilacus]|uniref:IrrE N-terminal-like domain-containing protein n=1 Tax=Microbacterium marinilacus TaxID=415209 RepID=A0ABP7BL08_9MICO|nr:ImmA/IrrE family metallo-endopeptidase [Microbacterium marinilacus]MBY0690384.1 ImmA/IrrE family metallo-endopeptidase [Microbacterium marinilacus]